MKILPLSFILCVVSVLADAGPKQAAGMQRSQSLELTRSHQRDGQTRIAEGEYEVYEEGSNGAVGPFGEEVYDFHESWTLTRDSRDTYHVAGERRFRTRPDSPELRRPFVVELSRDLTINSMTEFSNLKWIPDSGPLTCRFLANAMDCSAGGKKSTALKDWRIDVQHPYGLLWPISPFSLGSLVRESERDPRIVTRASLISIEQPSTHNPVSPMVLTGELQYLGIETLSAADRSWQAYKFSLKVPFHPKFMIWTSAKGMLLGLGAEHKSPDWPKEGLRLVRFQAFTDF